jgi:hypothetical protein
MDASSTNGITRRDSLAMMAGLVVTPGAMAQVVPSGTRAVASGTVQSAAPLAVIACWCERFGSEDRLRMAVDPLGRVRVRVEGSSGDGVELVRAFLAAGAASECLATLASVARVSHTFRWAQPDAWPEVCTFSMASEGVVRLPSLVQLELAASITARSDAQGVFEAGGVLSQAAEQAILATMSSDRVRATLVATPDRSAFLEAMRTWAAVPAVATELGAPDLWNDGVCPLVWCLGRTASPQQLAFVGQRIEAVIQQGWRFGVSVDVRILPPQIAEQVASKDPALAKALADVARLGGCQTDEPVVIARLGKPQQARPRAAPPIMAMLADMAAMDPGSSGRP